MEGYRRRACGKKGAGKEGSRKGGMQERRNAWMRDAGKEGFRNSGMQERRDSGKEGDRKWGTLIEGIRERRDSGREGCKELGIQERRDLGKEGCREVGIQEWCRTEKFDFWALIWFWFHQDWDMKWPAIFRVNNFFLRFFAIKFSFFATILSVFRELLALATTKFFATFSLRCTPGTMKIACCHLNIFI